MQYAKHKLIINTIVVAVVAIVMMVVAGWAMLYKIQDTGDMIYRVTQVFPGAGGEGGWRTGAV